MAVGTVVGAVQAELDALTDRVLATSVLAATALELARLLDADNSATSKSMVAGRLQDVMRELRSLAPVRVEGDGIDQLEARRSARRRSA